MQAQTDTVDVPETETESPVNPSPDEAVVQPQTEAAVSVEADSETSDAVDAAVAELAEGVVEVPGGVDAVVKQAEEVVSSGVSSNLVFLMGLGLLILFVIYFAAEAKRQKRIIGSILSVAVTGLCVWLYTSLHMEKGIELQGGVSMEIRIQPDEGREVNHDIQQQAIGVLAKRLDALGTGEIVLAPSGDDGIFLQMPGVGQETLAKIEETLQKVAKLEFSILHPQSSYLAARVANGAEVIPGYEALPYVEEMGEDGEPLPERFALVKIKRDMKGDNVSGASYFYGEKGDSISVSFTGAGSKIMGPLTLENRGQQLAIIMDEEILSAPVIQEPFSTGCSITGDFTQEEARALASALENPLGNPINVEYSNYISPTMGAATVQQGIIAGVSGLVFTFIFLVVYYRFAGVLALIGLSISVVMIFGIMSLFQFTLTLPGIAGIILTIGVAIDANVLIYERLREELAEGKTLATAIKTAYEKAFSAIIDANITTLITAIILYAVAAGTVKGFAITLIIGIFATLFAALIVSRVCFDWAIDKNLITKLTFMNMIPSKEFNFLGAGRASLLGSLVVAIISLILIPLMDPRGVELKGGDSLTIQSNEGLTKQSIAESISDLDLGGEPIIQVQQPVGAEGEFFLIRSSDGTAEMIEAEISKDLNVALDDTTVSSVGSAVGEAMLISSGLAILVGMGAILIYVTLRFEFAFALGAIVALIHDLIVTVGITTLLHQEISLITVGALLTIAGYSINDTIVVFDRVREGLATKRGNVRDIMNYSLNKTLSRTLLTGVTTLITVTVLLLFGGPGLRNFALTLIIGVIVGTYSSIFIASPIVLWWAKRSGTNLRREVLDTEQSKIDAIGGTQGA